MKPKFKAGDIVRTRAGDRFDRSKRQENLQILHRGSGWAGYPNWVCFNMSRGTRSAYLEKNLYLVQTGKGSKK